MRILVLMNVLACCWSEKVFPLNKFWFLSNEETGYTNLNATIPGGIYTDLMNNNVIPDIFYGYNDVKTRWISKTDWKYSTQFKVPANYLNHNRVNLVFEGIDTFSTIKINDAKVGSTDNMFVKYIFDVKPHLKPDLNSLTVEIKSPVKIAEFLYEQQLKRYEVPPRCVPKTYHGECHVNEIRKMQSSFAWDWGPAFPSLGIWKNVYLEAYNTVTIRYVAITTNIDKYSDQWDIVLHTYLSKGPNKGNLLVELDTEVEMVKYLFDVNCEEEHNELHCINKFRIPQMYVNRWWPNGYGKANLYRLKVQYISSDKTEISEKTVRIGFRTVELIQDPLKNGSTFYFRINDIPMYIKGSNIIPISVLPELNDNETTIDFLLRSAKDAHMNMLRVWGGGIYNSDRFYDTADELGILIWQDFMFACSMYPTTTKFLSSVRTEVRQQVKRLQHHPSIAIWAGNNENEAALSGNWYNTTSNFSLYRGDYVKLYVDVIMDEVTNIDKSRPFLTSSPTNGIETVKENYVASNPYSPYFGDIHYYNYLMDGWDANIYSITRFVSEYGFQSLPEIKTFRSATNKAEDYCIESNFMNHREHLFEGSLYLNRQVHFQLSKNDTRNSCEYFGYLTQIYQAMAIKIQTEFYREWRNNLNDAGQGFTMGAMYWQLNDVWVAPTWSSIDFDNRWKMLHYFAKKFFAPTIITGHVAVDRKLDLYLVCDLPQVPSINVQVKVSIYKWNQLTPKYQETISTTILPNAAKKIKTYEDIDKFIQIATNNECNKESCFLYFRLSGGIAPDNFIFLAPLKDSKLVNPNVKISNVETMGISGKTFKITVTSDGIALFVWLKAEGIRGQFSENGFLQVTVTKAIVFEAEVPTGIRQLQDCLSVKHLY